jgi:ATP-binding cassette subfamily B protein
MRLADFQKLQRLSPAFFGRTKAGDIVSRINNDIGELQKISSDTLLSLPFNVLLLTGNLTLMFYLDARLSLLSLLSIPAAIWGLRRYQGRLVAQVRTLREHGSAIGSFLIEAILGIRVVVTCNAQDRKDSEFKAHNDRFVKSLLSMQITSLFERRYTGGGRQALGRVALRLWRKSCHPTCAHHRKPDGVHGLPRPVVIARPKHDGHLLGTGCWFRFSRAGVRPSG